MNKREFLRLLGAGAIAGTAGSLITRGPDSGNNEADKSNKAALTSFERILESNTIRVSYASYAPNVMVDPNTGKMSGIYYELVGQMGDYLGLNIEWTEEVGWGEIAQGFKTGRADLCCANVWPTGPRAMQGNFSQPSYFSAVFAYVRNQEKRFQTYSDLNDPSVRIAVQDDDGITDIAKNLFPKAQMVSFPQMVDTKQRLIDVAYGKADVTFDDSYFAQIFMEKNPGQIKRLPVDQPLQVYANTFMFDNDDWRMKLLMDVALQEMHNSGTVTGLIQKYTGRTDSFLPVAKPYETGAIQ